MTALHRPARHPGPSRVPFPTVDEVSRHCVQDAEPETVHIEVHLPHAPDPGRLRSALTEAFARHPRALVREAAGSRWRRRYEWELTAAADVDPLRFTPPGPGALEAARERALATAPSLAQSPPIRLEVVGDVLVWTINHTALDGPACLRVIATTAELYGGRDNSPAAPAPLREAPAAAPARAPGSAWAPPARVAPGTPGTVPGNSMLLVDLPVPRRPKGAPYTVNDQLMIATALTLSEWNAERGAAPRPLRITMPVDDRPRGPEMPIGNGTRLVEVPFVPQELALPLPELLARTADRTRALKAVVRPQLGHGVKLLTTPVVPVGVRAAVTRGVRRAVGPWTSTTLLSNMGRIAYPLDFGDAGVPSRIWVSAPARMPRGLTFTTVSTGGRLFLALRWSKALLGDADGAHLRDLFERHLSATSAAEER
ncbi:condensation protein [Streptomyces sp. NPDC060194]|uniref:condensation protein n=1 Tax=Streptomyces sp. NPDC060194 TaxID=3347069 RepID=UPI00364642A2